MTATILNWDRIYRVVIGVPDDDGFKYIIQNTGISSVTSTTKTFDGSTIPSNAETFSNVSTEDDYIGYNFNFQLECSRKMSQSSSTQNEKTILTLYNLEDSTVRLLRTNGCVVRVYAGYKDSSLYLAYSGDVTRVVPSFDGQNNTTYKITCKDGANDAKNTRISIDYTGDIAESAVIEDLLGRFPSATKGLLATSDLDTTYTTGGHSYQGRLEDCFKHAIKANHLIYGRFNGKISVVPYRLSTSDTDYSNLLKNNYDLTLDLIKNIGPQSYSATTSTASSNSSKNIIVETFFLPFNFGSMFTIPSDTDSDLVNLYSGSYNIIGHKLTLDSCGENWNVTLLGSPIE